MEVIMRKSMEDELESDILAEEGNTLGSEQEVVHYLVAGIQQDDSSMPTPDQRDKASQT